MRFAAFEKHLKRPLRLKKSQHSSFNSREIRVKRMEKIEVVYIRIECAYDSAQAKSQFDMPNGDKDQHFSIEL